MKKFILILSLMITFVFLTNVNVNGAGSGSTLISPTNAQFKAASSPKYTSSTATIYGEISSAGEVDLYHFEAPYEGYYAFYTTGTLDTVGALFEEQNFLWWTTEYKNLDHNDDYMYSQFGRNFRIIVRLARGEDYYIAVRGYGSYNTGSYRLRIEPNEDDRTFEFGGTWKAENMPNSAALTGVWTSKKTYYTADQAEMYYLMLDSDAQDAVELAQNILVTQGIKTSVSVISSLIGKAIIVTAFATTPPGWVAGAIAITASAMAALINSTYDNTLNNNFKLQTKLRDLLGITISYTYINGDAAKVVHAEHGLLVEQLFVSNTIPAYNDFHEVYDSTKLVGEKYYKGSWE